MLSCCCLHLHLHLNEIFLVLQILQYGRELKNSNGAQLQCFSIITFWVARIKKLMRNSKWKIRTLWLHNAPHQNSSAPVTCWTKTRRKEWSTGPGGMGQVHHHRPLTKSERVFSVIRTTTKKWSWSWRNLLPMPNFAWPFHMWFSWLFWQLVLDLFNQQPLH